MTSTTTTPMMVVSSSKMVLLLVFVLVEMSRLSFVSSFSLPRQQHQHAVGRISTPTSATIAALSSKNIHFLLEDNGDCVAEKNRRKTLLAAVFAITSGLGLGGGITAAYADEYGRESEAPTMFTGENVEICVKRGPLGACTKTELRTAENENDKSEKYFRQPTELVKRKDNEARQSATAEDEGNELIARLKQQTEDNREKNELLVKQRTMVNDASASFGPFDQQVLILNEDGKGFSLLANPQAMRLKKAGLIGDDKKFTRQPTQEELDAALESGPGLFDRFFGGSD